MYSVGGAMAFDPNIDNALIKELEAAEKQAQETAQIINELKERLAVLVAVGINFKIIYV